MSERYVQIFWKRRYTDGKWAHIKDHKKYH